MNLRPGPKSRKKTGRAPPHVRDGAGPQQGKTNRMGGAGPRKEKKVVVITRDQLEIAQRWRGARSSPPRKSDSSGRRFALRNIAS